MCRGASPTGSQGVVSDGGGHALTRLECQTSCPGSDWTGAPQGCPRASGEKSPGGWPGREGETPRARVSGSRESWRGGGCSPFHLPGSALIPAGSGNPLPPVQPGHLDTERDQAHPCAFSTTLHTAPRERAGPPDSKLLVSPALYWLPHRGPHGHGRPDAPRA